jgi:SdrD B-like domain/SprB repeat/Secretion system C-terminal sorting domain
MIKKLYLLFLLVATSFTTIFAQCGINMVVSSTNITCNGANNGTITMTIDPTHGLCNATLTGPGGITRLGTSNAAGLLTFNNVAVGSWNVYVVQQGGTGCEYTDNVTISQPAPLSVSINNGVVCAQDSRAQSLAPTINGGNAGLSFMWSTGATTRPIFVTTSGVYSLTVTDILGCVASGSSLVSVLPAPTLTFTTADDICAAGNGTATVNVTGGLPAFSYAWSTGALTQSITGRPAGGYSVTVTDSEGCKYKQNVTITPYSQCTRSVTGRVIYDLNCNGVINAGETGLSGFTISLRRNMQNGATTTTQTDANGNYSFVINSADIADHNYVVTVIPPAGNTLPSQNPTPTIDINNLANGTTSANNNYFFCNGASDLSVVIVCSKNHDHAYSPADRIRVIATIRNNGSNPLSANLTVSNSTGFTNTQALANMAAGETRTITLNSVGAYPAACGTFITTTAALTITTGTDNNAANNTTTCSTGDICPPATPLCNLNPATTFPICSGWNPATLSAWPMGTPCPPNLWYNQSQACNCCATDPNNKLVHPERSFEVVSVDNVALSAAGIFESDEVLTYTLNFQNVGNWYAHDVVIKDLIDTDVLDLSTIAPFAGSHNYFYGTENNLLTFTFPNIILPDSTRDEPGSHGFVSFTIKRKPGLAVGTVIENYVDIYFDYNPAVRTNTARSVIISPTTDVTEVSQSFNSQVLPNPSSGTTILEYALTQPETVSIQMVDMNGRILSVVADNIPQSAGKYRLPINFEQYAVGVYLVQIKTLSKVETLRFVKL